MKREQQPLAGGALVLATFGVALATFMQTLDITIANVSIPAIAGDLGVSPAQGTWVITSFAVANAIAVPLTGWLARRFGEVRLFTVATLLFIAASLGCGLADSLPMLLVFRVFQGVAAGPMIPLSQTLLLSIYPPASKGMALALWSMTTLLAPIAGPLLGGWITDNISWPWIFYINIPVGLVAAYLTHGLLQSRETARQRSPVDAVSLGLLVLGVGALQLMLDQGRELDWFNSKAIVMLAVMAGISLPYLVVRELGTEHPLLDLRLFSRRTFTVGAVALSLGYGVYFGNFVLVPLWLQTQLGYTATWAGMALAPTGILAVLLSPLVGKHLKRFDLRLAASFAFLVFALCAFWRAGFTTGLDFGHLALVQTAQGVGTAVFFVALVTILLSGLPPERIASAAGLSNFLRITAGSFAASLTTTWWDRRQALHQTELSAHVNPYNPLALDALDKLSALGLGVNESYASLLQTASTQAYMLAANDLFWLQGWLFLALVPVVWFPRAAPTAHPATPG
jgi:DHA2 family multidrug resistance protein